MPHSIAPLQSYIDWLKAHPPTALVLMLVAGHAGIFLTTYMLHITGFLSVIASIPGMQAFASAIALCAWTMLIFQLVLSTYALFYGIQFRVEKLSTDSRDTRQELRRNHPILWHMFNAYDLLASSSRVFPLSLAFGCAPPIMYFLGADAMTILVIYLTFMLFNIFVGTLYAGLDISYTEQIVQVIGSDDRNLNSGRGQAQQRQRGVNNRPYQEEKTELKH